MYANDLQNDINIKTIQYADDTTLYTSKKVSLLDIAEKEMTDSLQTLTQWSNTNKMSLNQSKTKTILFSTKRLSSVHSLDQYPLKVHIDVDSLKRETSVKLLGVFFDQHLTWQNHITHIISTSYGKLSILKKLKHFAPFQIRKQLAQTYIMAKIDYMDYIYSPLTQYQIKQLQRLQLVTCSFVYGKYASYQDILNLKWLPIIERRKFNLLKTIFKAVYNENWPNTCRLEIKRQNRVLRNNDMPFIQFSTFNDTFQYQAQTHFNTLQIEDKRLTKYNELCAVN